MAAGSVETTLELWASSLRDVKGRIRPLFRQARMAQSAGLFLDALLGPERRKTGWMRAEAAGDPGPWRQQALLGRALWDADALRDVVRDYVVETLAEPDAVLVLDETGFLKQGKASCGVGRQYTGSAGKITNCQIGVFAAYVSDKGHAFLDRSLYLPQDWAKNPARLRAAHVPEEVGFTTKPRLALDMIERAINAGVPFTWVAASAPSTRACPLPGWRLTRSTARARLRWCCAAPARATCSGSAPRSPSTLGLASRRWPARPKRSHEVWSLRRGCACPRAKAPKGLGCMTGLTWNWLILRPMSSIPP